MLLVHEQALKAMLNYARASFLLKLGFDDNVMCALIIAEGLYVEGSQFKGAILII